MINADSMSWLNKAGNSIGKYITASIENGKLFELASFGANMFGVPSILEHGSTHRPVLNFEPGPDHELNLTHVYMQDSAGKLNHWASSPSMVATPSPLSWPNPQTNLAASSLPQRPPAGSMLSSVSVALSNFHKAQRGSSYTDKPSSMLSSSQVPGEAGNSGFKRRPTREEYEARINAGSSSLTSPGEGGSSGFKRRPTREEYEAKINARPITPAASKAYSTSQADDKLDFNVQKDANQRLAESVQSMREHQDEMQRAQAFLSAEPEVPYSKSRLSRQAFEDRLNGKR
jgi:hypothetical protein